MPEVTFETLQEFTDARQGRLQVDRPRSVIRGVKILGLQSRNGRVYLPAALAGAAELYENARVNVNHPKGHPHSPRDYQDRIGTLRGVTVRDGEGLFGDLHLNPAHALAEQLLWDAENAPANVGLSHNVQAQTVRRAGQTVVEAILKVQGVDLVADPATTRGLFEACDRSQCDNLAASVGDPTTSTAGDQPATLTEAIVALDEALARAACLQAERDELANQLQQHRDQALRQGRRTLVRRLLAEHGLPDLESTDHAAQTLVSATFVESLLAADSEAAMRELIVERAGLVAAARGIEVANPSPPIFAPSRPRSREQRSGPVLEINNVKEFVRAIT